MEINKALDINGNWLVSNCGDLPSEMGCKLVMMAPESQRSDLIEASVAHAVNTHSHADTPELRTEIGQMIATKQF